MRQAHQQLRQEQDQHLDEINEVADRLKIGSKNINGQLNKQGGLIKDLDGAMDDTMSKMNFVQKKLSKLLKTNDMGQICTILILFVILIVMIFLVIYT